MIRNNSKSIKLFSVPCSSVLKGIINDLPQTSSVIYLRTNTLSTNNDSARRKLKDNSQLKKTSEGRFSCDKCESSFARKNYLTTHIKSKHEGVKYACNQCDYQATQQSNLTVHIKSKHEGVKYACNECDQQFTLQQNLITHIKSKHEGLKYACNQCDFQATRHFNLTKHINLKHKA